MSELKDNQNVVSAEGLRKLKEELEYLKNTRRQEVAEQIAVARSFGDLSENAEYDEAKNEQSKLESKIIEIENAIRNAVVIDEKDIKTDAVNVGAIVKVKDMTFDEELEYIIVGSSEINLAENKISATSPVGAALLGKKKNEKISIETPGGVVEMKILQIRRQK